MAGSLNLAGLGIQPSLWEHLVMATKRTKADIKRSGTPTDWTRSQSVVLSREHSKEEYATTPDEPLDPTTNLAKRLGTQIHSESVFLRSVGSESQL